MSVVLNNFVYAVKLFTSVFACMRRMFNGILSDVIGRDGHVSETGNCNKNNNNDDGAGDCCRQLFYDHSTRDAASMVSVFERHVTHYNNHVLRMRDQAAVTSSSTDALRSVSCRRCDQEVGVSTNIETPTSVSYSRLLSYYGRPLSVSGRPCYNLPVFIYLFIYYGRFILRPWLMEVRESFTRGEP